MILVSRRTEFMASLDKRSSRTIAASVAIASILIVVLAMAGSLLFDSRPSTMYANAAIAMR